MIAKKITIRVQTLMNWCCPFMEELESMGMQHNTKLLPPHIVQFITDKFTIGV